MADLNTGNLYTDDIDAKPIDVDWGEVGDWVSVVVYPNYHAWSEAELREYLDDQGVEPDDGDDLAELAQETDNEYDSFTPMMNYAYPITLRGVEPAAAQGILARAMLPLTVVNLYGDDYLALTGGGMDLSWDICEAYIRLGQYPPAHFADLPGMAGRGESTRDKAIIMAAVRSLELSASWRASAAERVRERYGVTASSNREAV